MIYEKKSIRESIHEDILNHECFFDENAFADYYDIDGTKILGILTESKSSRLYDSERGVSGQREMIFMCRCRDVRNVSVNNIVRINKRAYYVTEAMRVENLYWKIRLLVNE